MQKAYRVLTRIASDRSVTLEDIPFAPGTEVEIILLLKDELRDVANPYPRGVNQPPLTERVPGSAKGLIVVPDDFDAPLDFTK